MSVPNLKSLQNKLCRVIIWTRISKPDRHVQSNTSQLCQRGELTISNFLSADAFNLEELKLLLQNDDFRKRACKNIVRKAENAGNQHFQPFSMRL